MPVTIVPNGPASDSVNGDWISDKVIFSFHCRSLFTRMHHLCSVSSSINVHLFSVANFACVLLMMLGLEVLLCALKICIPFGNEKCGCR
jgi:hypothetical protein